MIKPQLSLVRLLSLFLSAFEVFRGHTLCDESEAYLSHMFGLRIWRSPRFSLQTELRGSNRVFESAQLQEMPEGKVVPYQSLSEPFSGFFIRFACLRLFFSQDNCELVVPFVYGRELFGGAGNRASNLSISTRNFNRQITFSTIQGNARQHR